MSFNKESIRRFLSAYIVILLLVASFSIIFVPLYSANINGTQPGKAQTSSAQTSTGNTGENSDDDNDTTGDDDDDSTGDDDTGGNGDNNDDAENNNNGNSNNGGSTGNTGYTPVANNDVTTYETTSSQTVKKETMTSNPTTSNTATSKKVEKALKGEKLEIIPENSVETGICRIDITAAVDLEDLELTVTKLEEKPIEIIEPPAVDKKKVCKYLEIKLTTENEYMKNEQLDLTNIEFEVTKEWIDENNIDKETIKLHRYQDDDKDNEWEWMELETELIDKNDEYTYYYKAITPGFSTFAIVGSEVVEISESYSTSGIIIPWTFIIGGTAITIIFLTAFLFKTGYIYFGDEKNSIKKKKSCNK